MLFLLLLRAVLACDELSLMTPASQSSVTQSGSTINFEAPRTVGQFANGDYWVLGPVRISSMTPAFTGTANGHEINPSGYSAATGGQGYDSRVSNFNATRAVALPVDVAAGSSVVKARSVAPGSCRPCLQTAIVLTVVDAVPPNNGHRTFRPAYFGASGIAHRLSANFRSIDSVSLAHSPRWSSTLHPPSLALNSIFGWHRRLQLDQVSGYQSRYVHPIDSMPDYGAGIGMRAAVAWLRLFYDDVSPTACATVVAIQAGVDHYSLLDAGMSWGANGGHQLGRKMLIVAAAAALGDATMIAAARDAVAALRFHEDQSVLQQTAPGVWLWGAFSPYSPDYWDIVRTGQGFKTVLDPYKYVDGGPKSGGSYDYCCNAKPFSYWSLVTHSSGLIRSISTADGAVNNSYYYGLRWMTHGVWAQPDPCAPIVGQCGDASPCSSASPDCAVGSCTYDGGALEGVAYGDDGNGGCILDTDASDGIGRWPQQHGALQGAGHYGHAFGDEAWANWYVPAAASSAPPTSAPPTSSGDNGTTTTTTAANLAGGDASGGGSSTTLWLLVVLAVLVLASAALGAAALIVRRRRRADARLYARPSRGGSSGPSRQASRSTSNRTSRVLRAPRSANESRRASYVVGAPPPPNYDKAPPPPRPLPPIPRC